MNILDEVLFDGKSEITYSDVVKRMSNYIYETQEAIKINVEDRRKALELARKIRSSLEREYKHNSLQKISKFYEDNPYFEAFYKPAVQEAIASIAGPLNYGSVVNFLYDVKYYMNYYTPTKNQD